MADRQYSKTINQILSFILIGWVIFHLWANTFGFITLMDLRAFHCMFLLTFTFLLVPSFKGNKILFWYDIIFILLSCICLFIVILTYPDVIRSGGRITGFQETVALVLLCLVILAGWRTSRNLTILAFIFLAYNFIGRYIPGYLGHTGFTLKRVLISQVWGTQGIFGTGVGVSVSYIFLFIILGAFLKYSGFSQFINDLSLSLVGATAGGPAKVAVLSSALMGMINGSAVANVATTGTITIPLMKQTGYKSEFAAAVEATASTGGQFCPPIMGAVGFIMAEFLNISYSKVILVAIVPAFLYYLGILLSVHFEAKRLGLSGISRENIPSTIKVLKERGYLIVPLVFLITMISCGFTPVLSAVLSIPLIIGVSWIKKDTGMDWKKIKKACVEGARSSIGVGISCILIGIIIGTVTLTSLGLNIGYMVLNTSLNNNIYLVGLLTMLVSVVLGMGVPGVAAYVIVQAVAVPILIKAGVIPIVAHLFCLIYACLSNITPPVAISCYVASGIADSNQTKTGLLAVRIGLIGFLIPFFFLNNPILLLGVGSAGFLEAFLALVSAVLGTILLTMTLEGWSFNRLSIWERALLLISSLFLLYTGWITDLIGLLIGLSIILYNRKKIS